MSDYELEKFACDAAAELGRAAAVEKFASECADRSLGEAVYACLSPAHRELLGCLHEARAAAAS